jgi:group I intron endonuclease
MQVYAIQNEANGKLYIGQHAGYDLLWYLRENTESARRGSTSKRLLYRAMRKYGPLSFTIRPIHVASDKADMDRAEKAYIKLFGTRNKDLGYNLTDGGEGMCGYVPTPETRKKLRDNAIARGGISAKCRDAQKLYLKHRVITEQHKERLSMSKKGKPLTEEHKAALRKPKRKANNVDARI